MSAIAPTAIAPTAWRWFGHPGHFVNAEKCQFRLHTRVGNWRISTVGDYYPHGTDEPRATLGPNRTHETFVFRVLGHGAGEPTDWREVETKTYNIAEDATPAECEAVVGAGHILMCMKYAKTR